MGVLRRGKQYATMWLSVHLTILLKHYQARFQETRPTLALANKCLFPAFEAFSLVSSYLFLEWFRSLWLMHLTAPGSRQDVKEISR